MTPEQRESRLRHHMYETNEGIQQQSERIVALEELVGELMFVVCGMCIGRICEVPKDKHPFVTCTYNDRIEELEVPL